MGAFKGILTEAEILTQIVEPIKPGTILASGHTFEGTDGTRVLLRTPDGETLRLRLAPELKEGDPLRLIIEGAPQRSDVEALRHAVAQLRGVLTQRHRKLTSRVAARA